MRYIPHSPEEQASLLAAIGVASMDELFATVPSEVYRREPPDLPPPASEIEVRRTMGALAARNANLSEWTSLLGAGLYSHHMPAFVSQLLARGEFLTAYTPYQPEVSQGTLTAVWEFQTHMALLTELDVANASMYEGASAFVEAVLMAERLTRKRTKVVVSKGIHPEYRSCLRTYLANFPFTIVEVPVGDGGATDRAALAAAVDETTFAVAVQSPNVLGVVESWEAAAAAAHEKGALAIGVVNEMFSLALLKGPGACGIDIAAGEAASFGVPPSFGGPLVGFLACRDAMKRQIPGRLIGRTTDSNGKTAFCLTLSTREQHIRRERATSNICTNQGLVMLAATVGMCLYGKAGLREMSLRNLTLSQELKKRLFATKGFSPLFTGPTFNEIAVKGRRPASEVLPRLRESGVVAGPALLPYYPDQPDAFLVTVTERNTIDEIEKLCSVLATI